MGVSRSALPAELCRKGGERHPRHKFPVNYEMRCGYSKGPLFQRCSLWGHDDVRGNRRAYDKGAHSTRALDHENQSGRSTRAEVLSVDRWVDSLFFEYFPADVDFEGRICRVGPNNRAQEVLLRLCCQGATLWFALFFLWLTCPSWHSA